MFQFLEDLHVCQVIKNVFIQFFATKYLTENEKSEESLEYLFFCACFIVIKLELPCKLATFKEYLCENDINFEVLKETETYIINKTGWKLYFGTSEELKNLIMAQYIDESEVGFINNFDFQFQSWLNVCLRDHRIYENFNVFIITVSILTVSMKLIEMEKTLEKLKFLILNNFSEEDIVLISDCARRIVEDQMAFENEIDSQVGDDKDYATTLNENEYITKEVESCVNGLSYFSSMSTVDEIDFSPTSRPRRTPSGKYIRLSIKKAKASESRQKTIRRKSNFFNKGKKFCASKGSDLTLTAFMKVKKETNNLYKGYTECM